MKKVNQSSGNWLCKFRPFPSMSNEHIQALFSGLGQKRLSPCPCRASLWAKEKHISSFSGPVGTQELLMASLTFFMGLGHDDTVNIR